MAAHLTFQGVLGGGAREEQLAGVCYHHTEGGLDPGSDVRRVVALVADQELPGQDQSNGGGGT